MKKIAQNNYLDRFDFTILVFTHFDVCLFYPSFPPTQTKPLSKLKIHNKSAFLNSRRCFCSWDTNHLLPSVISNEIRLLPTYPDTYSLHPIRQISTAFSWILPEIVDIILLFLS